MTEDEAKTKACCGPHRERVPYGSAKDADEIAYQGLDPLYPAEVAARFPCIASACMAWRRNVALFDRMTGEPAIPGVAAIGDLEPRYTSHGYCGLAGQTS